MTLIYEGAVSSGEVGGAREHFRGMARALDRHASTRLIVIVPAFRGEAPLDLGLLRSARVVRIPALHRGIWGHLSYELLKIFAILIVRLQDIAGREPTIMMSRITPVGLAAPLVRAVGVWTAIEVNGLPDDEFASRGYGAQVVRAVRFVVNAQLRSASFVVAVTEGLARDAGCRTMAPTMRLENGVDVESLAVSPAAAQAGRRHTVVYSGAFAPWQEIALLVKAIARLVADDESVDWRLLLIGDGEDRHVVERTVAELGIADQVEVTGWLERDAAVRRLLEGRIAVVPLKPKSDSGSCGSPLKLFEFLAMGRTVVGSDVDGIVELDGYPIAVYNQGSVDSLVEVIRSAASAPLVSEEDIALRRSLVSWDERCLRACRFLSLHVERSPNADESKRSATPSDR